MTRSAKIRRGAIFEDKARTSANSTSPIDDIIAKIKVQSTSIDRSDIVALKSLVGKSREVDNIPTSRIKSIALSVYWRRASKRCWVNKIISTVVGFGVESQWSILHCWNI
jgi:hypothetical protein